MAATTERGYGHAHRALRAEWAPHVEAGEVNCWRCGQRIQPGEPWHLGHDDHDRSLYRGPEHARQCNLAAAGRKKAELERVRRRRPAERHPGLRA